MLVKRPVLLYALKGQSLSNLVSESVSRLKLFQTSNFKQPLALLDLAERR
jgi:hypothetical protein